MMFTDVFSTLYSDMLLRKRNNENAIVKRKKISCRNFCLCIRCVYGHLRYNVTHANTHTHTKHISISENKVNCSSECIKTHTMHCVRDYAASVFVIAIWILSLIINVM